MKTVRYTETKEDRIAREKRLRPWMKPVGRYGAAGAYLTRDGAPWFPVMGEFHFSRFRKEFWREEIARMKAGGIQVLATYVFWIHHEERKGVWDFTGQRDLRSFLKICGEEQMPVFLRIGPWSHGECRNGGFPDWLLRMEDCKLRTNDPAYLERVTLFWKRIFREADGYFHEQGGPVVGIQIENEYGHCGGLTGDAGKEHMMTLRSMAEALGFRAPYYTATGWGGGIVPEGFLPVLAAYCGAPWEQHVNPLPLNENYLFSSCKDDGSVGSDRKEGDISGLTYDAEQVPYLMAELGGGLQVTAHRRPLVTAADTAALALCRLGSGANLLGYYMYHGGTNPEGKDSTLQESRETGYSNDLPVWSYDFQAPQGEFGRIHESYYRLRPLHQFLKDFGSLLAGTVSVIPRWNAAVPEDTESFRAACRHLPGKGMGFFFYNGYQRHGKTGTGSLQVTVEESGGRTELPILRIEDGQMGILPYASRESGGLELTPEFRVYSSDVQPLCTLGKDVVFWGHGCSGICWEGEGKAICVTPWEAEHGVKYREDGEEKWFAAEGCLYEEQGKLLLLTEKPKGDVTVYPGKERRPYACEEAEFRGDIRLLRRNPEWVEYEIRVECRDPGTFHDLWIRLELTGDRGELYLDNAMRQDWFCQGGPWDLSWRYLGYPKAFRIRVYAAGPPEEVYYEVPQQGLPDIRSVKWIPDYELLISSGSRKKS